MKRLILKFEKVKGSVLWSIKKNRAHRKQMGYEEVEVEPKCLIVVKFIKDEECTYNIILIKPLLKSEEFVLNANKAIEHI